MTEAEAPLLPSFLPYGRQTIEEDDIAAVVEVLRSEWLTTGPAVDRFESTFAAVVGAKHAVAVSNGTAALHCAMVAAGIHPGDEVIVPAITFVSTASSVVFQGATPVFADVESDTLLVDPESVCRRITPRTKALIGVDYAGQPCDWDALREIADEHSLVLIDDACHALGGAYKGRPVGSLADLNTFSFHPVKNITTAEGGMITTDNPELAVKMQVFRNHGITTNHRQRAEAGTWRYEMTGLGYNYRLSDIHAALGSSQVQKLSRFVSSRRRLAHTYDQAFSANELIRPLTRKPDRLHSFHLYVIRLHDSLNRESIFALLRGAGIGANVHYAPIHLHPFYREKVGSGPGMCSTAEDVAPHILTLPLHPGMDEQDVSRVADTLINCIDSDLNKSRP